MSLETEQTRLLETKNIRFAYRSFGQTQGVPLVFLQHFTGTMDSWDPAVVNPLAETRPVVVFNNTGIGASSGTTPDSVEQMAADAAAFIEGLKFKQMDLGGFIAQVLAAQKPDLVRKIIVAGSRLAAAKSIS